MNDREETKKMEKWEKQMRKINQMLRTVSLFLFIVGGGLFSIFLIVAYGLPIKGFEKNQNLVLSGFYFLGILLFAFLFWKGLDILFTYIKKKQGRLTTEMQPGKWPSPEKRTVKNTLTFMSKKIGILVWDIIVGCIVVALVITGLVDEAFAFWKSLTGCIGLLCFWLGIRLLFLLYYSLRNYTKSLLKNYDSYGGYLDHGVLLDCLEDSLKNRLFFYSSQWIITEDFLLAWGKTYQLFSPVAISFQEMRFLRYEVQENVFNSGKTFNNNVIVCQLKSGHSVNLFIGDNWNANTIISILNHFRIPFENTLQPKGDYVPPFEVTATPPDTDRK